MDIKQLRYFVSIARNRSFSRASAHLRIAQPALSSQIAALETELKTRLFVRHSRGVDLTEAGQALLPRAQNIIDEVDETARDIRALSERTTFEVRLGLPTTTTGVVAMPLIDAFSARHPGIVLHIVEGMTGHLDKWLEQDEIDIAILYDKSAFGSMSVACVGRERLVVIGSDLDAFAGRGTVSFQDLANMPLVHTTRAHQLRRMIETYSSEVRVPLNLLAEIDSLAQIRELLLSISGCTILPESTSFDWHRHGLRSWPIVAPEINIAHHLVCSPRFARHVAAETVLGLVADVTRDLIAGGRWPGATLDDADGPQARTLVDTLGR